MSKTQKSRPGDGSLSFVNERGVFTTIRVRAAQTERLETEGYTILEKTHNNQTWVTELSPREYAALQAIMAGGRAS